MSEPEGEPQGCWCDLSAEELSEMFRKRLCTALEAFAGRKTDEPGILMEIARVLNKQRQMFILERDLAMSHAYAEKLVDEHMSTGTPYDQLVREIEP